MFRAKSCSFSGGQIVLITASGIATVSKWTSGARTGLSLTDSDDTRCCINPYPANVEKMVSS